MTHYIFETMVFERKAYMGHRDITVAQECAGHRMSADGGKSWIVAGRITVSKADSFESRVRSVSLREYSMRLAQGANRTLTITDASNRDRSQSVA